MRIRESSVGWESAESSANNSQSPVTLKEVVDNFHNCNADNPESPIDQNHPWCRLIDPNWVLKYPETMCKAQVPSQTLIAKNTDMRAEVCVDTPSCIQEDENGNCTGGFGYCTREQNIWRFGGDTCPVQYASCLSFTSRLGQAANYQTNTVDFADCDGENAGCLWYGTENENCRSRFRGG